MDIYVSTTGSDLSGVGSMASPYRTLGRALPLLRNGGRVLVYAGEYVESGMLSIVGLEQARIQAVNPASTLVRTADGSPAALLALTDCQRCVVDGLDLRSPTNGQAAGMRNVLRIQGGRGNLVTDCRVTWTASGMPSGVTLGAFSILSSQDSRILRCSVQDCVVTGAAAGGLFAPYLAEDASFHVADSRVGSIRTDGGVDVIGIFARSTVARAVARVDRVRIADVEAWATDTAPPSVTGIRVDGVSPGAYELVVRDSLVGRVRGIGSDGTQLTTVDGGGIRTNCLADVDISGFVAAQCGVGVDLFDVPEPSTLNRITLHRCDIGIRSTAANPPSRYKVRNVSFSALRIAMQSVGLPGSTFFDLDFANFYDIDGERWFDAADPVASTFDVGPNVREFAPLFTDPDNLDFTPTSVSGLINRGGDF